MVFNEILIPQDSFTETNVTRKRSIVGIRDYISKTNFIEIITFNLYTFLYA